MKRIPIIDFIRFFSIFVVIGGHFFPRWIAHGYSNFLQKFILDLFLSGAYGVTFFFVISGFLITQMLVNGKDDFSKIDLKAFYAKRAARIFPLMVAIVLVGLSLNYLKAFMDERLAHYNSWNVDGGFGFSFWLSLLTFNFNWFLISKSDSLIGTHWAVFWSLAVEEQFYFFYPLFLKTFKKRKSVLWFLAVVIVFAVFFRAWCFYEMDHKDQWMHEASFSSFDQIAVGAILYFLWDRLKYPLKQKTWTAVLLLVAGLIICFYFYVTTLFVGNISTIYVPTLMATGCAMVILGGMSLSFFNSDIASVLSWPGKLSYGCYLWHATFIYLFMPLWAWLGGLSAFTVLLILVLVFSYFSYEYFEVPANRRIRAWFKLKPSTTEV